MHHWGRAKGQSTRRRVEASGTQVRTYCEETRSKHVSSTHFTCRNRQRQAEIDGNGQKQPETARNRQKGTNVDEQIPADSHVWVDDDPLPVLLGPDHLTLHRALVAEKRSETGLDEARGKGEDDDRDDEGDDGVTSGDDAWDGWDDEQAGSIIRWSWSAEQTVRSANGQPTVRHPLAMMSRAARREDGPKAGQPEGKMVETLTCVRQSQQRCRCRSCRYTREKVSPSASASASTSVSASTSARSLQHRHVRLESSPLGISDDPS